MAEFYLCKQPGCNRKYKTPKGWITHMQEDHNKKDQILILPSPVAIGKRANEEVGGVHIPKNIRINNEAFYIERAIEARIEQEQREAAARQEAIRRAEAESREQFLLEQQLRKEILETSQQIQNYVRENPDTCTICMENASNAAVVPCGHAYFCYECITEYLESFSHRGCPFCRGKMDNVIRIYK